MRRLLGCCSARQILLASPGSMPGWMARQSIISTLVSCSHSPSACAMAACPGKEPASNSSCRTTDVIQTSPSNCWSSSSSPSRESAISGSASATTNVDLGPYLIGDLKIMLDILLAYRNDRNTQLHQHCHHVWQCLICYSRRIA